MDSVPQPGVPRIVAASGHPLVVGVGPKQTELVARTAAVWASALGSSIVFAYADPSRSVEAEGADSTIRHVPLDPDSDDDDWLRTQDCVTTWLKGLNLEVDWEFRYLAGRADRALTHLARAVDAGAIVVGARPPSSTRFGKGHTLGQELARHQHRPVLVVPLSVVDWKRQ